MTDQSEKRSAFMTKLFAFGHERLACIEAYIVDLTDEELAAAVAPFRSSSNKRFTGRESTDGLKPTPRDSLTRLRRRIWDAAGQPGKSEALRAWDDDPKC